MDYMIKMALPSWLALKPPKDMTEASYGLGQDGERTGFRKVTKVTKQDMRN